MSMMSSAAAGGLTAIQDDAMGPAPKPRSGRRVLPATQPCGPRYPSTIEVMDGAWEVGRWPLSGDSG